METNEKRNPEQVHDHELEVDVRMAMTSKLSDEEMRMPDVDEEFEKFRAERMAATKQVSLTSWRKMVAAAAVLLLLVGVTFAAISLTKTPSQEKSKTASAAKVAEGAKAALTEGNDTTKAMVADQVYENVELQQIVSDLCKRYGLQARFDNKEAMHMRLYFQMKGNASLDEIVNALNHFEKVNIEHRNQLLIIR